MAPPLLKLDNVHLSFGGTPLLTGAALTAGAGERICLIGRNGSGKSTLLKIAAGLVEPDSGDRFLHPNARVRYLGQESDFTGYDTTLAYVEAALGPADDLYQARYMLELLGLTGDENPNRLSGGEARRAALAAVLAPEPELLLLDEPTNHLDLPAIEWLEQAIGASKSGIILISHDRRFLERLSRQTLWLDRGVTRSHTQGFSAFEDWRDHLLEVEEAERHKLDRKIVREQKWMHGGVTGRRKRNVRRVAELAKLRQTVQDQRKVVGNVQMEVSEAGASGKLVAELTDVSKAYGGAPVVSGLTLRIGRGDRLGIVGPNGAGKTTLLGLITGQLAPDDGKVRIGTNLEMVMLDQKRADLDPETRVADTLTGGRGDFITVAGQRRHVASYLEDFLFQGEQAMSPVKVLSGGERARLLLAKALATPSNLLVLDEPTNDLDLETLDLLQEMLSDYPGTILLVSHDRDFLDRVVTSVLAHEGSGRWQEYAGGYRDMIAQRRGQDLAARRQASSASKSDQAGQSAGPGGASPSKKRLSFKDKHALETLPGTIEKLTSEITKLQTVMADQSLFTKSPDKFKSTNQRLGAATAELAAAEERWLELELLRSEIEGGSNV
jgi:ABC transport system ATP-binding/permease protein